MDRNQKTREPGSNFFSTKKRLDLLLFLSVLSLLSKLHSELLASNLYRVYSTLSLCGPVGGREQVLRPLKQTDKEKPQLKEASRWRLQIKHQKTVGWCSYSRENWGFHVQERTLRFAATWKTHHACNHVETSQEARCFHTRNEVNWRNQP